MWSDDQIGMINPGLPQTQGIFKFKKISGNFDLFFKLGETQGSFDFF